jgi:hypothetical protein
MVSLAIFFLIDETKAHKHLSQTSTKFQYVDEQKVEITIRINFMIDYFKAQKENHQQVRVILI